MGYTYLSQPPSMLILNRCASVLRKPQDTGCGRRNMHWCYPCQSCIWLQHCPGQYSANSTYQAQKTAPRQDPCQVTAWVNYIELPKGNDQVLLARYIQNITYVYHPSYHSV